MVDAQAREPILTTAPDTLLRLGLPVTISRLPPCRWRIWLTALPLVSARAITFLQLGDCLVTAEGPPRIGSTVSWTPMPWRRCADADPLGRGRNLHLIFSDPSRGTVC